MKAQCKDCIHRAKKGGCLYCLKEHYFPRPDMIRAWGCRSYKQEEHIDLLQIGKEDSDGNQN